MKVYSSYSEPELLLLIRECDLNAYNELYTRYAEKLLLYVYAKLGDLEESRDIVQEIFVFIWLQRQDLDMVSSISGYLHKIALNKSLNIFRRRKIESNYIDSLSGFLADSMFADEDDNSEVEHEKVLAGILKHLPERMRMVFELRYFSGMSNLQVAEALQISPHTVATQMKRALKIIRKGTTFFVFFSVIINL